MDKMLTVKQVARKYRVKERQVLYAVRRDLLSGEKVGWIWLFPEDKLPQRWPVRKQKLRGCRGT